MQKVMITGATGFIGSNLVKAFSEQGILIYAVVQRETSLNKLLKSENVIPIVCKNSDIENLHHKINDRDIDASII